MGNGGEEVQDFGCSRAQSLATTLDKSNLIHEPRTHLFFFRLDLANDGKETHTTRTNIWQEWWGTGEGGDMEKQKSNWTRGLISFEARRQRGAQFAMMEDKHYGTITYRPGQFYWHTKVQKNVNATVF